MQAHPYSAWSVSLGEKTEQEMGLQVPTEILKYKNSQIFFFPFLARRVWDFVCDTTVTPAGHSKQNKLKTSITDVSPKEGLWGVPFKWLLFALFLVIAK